MPRRAATPRKSVELDRPRIPVVAVVLVLLGLGATGGAIMWGTSDSGQINVSATIANSQQTTGNEEGAPRPTPTPTEVHRTMPNGGLVAQSGDTPRAPEPIPAPTEEATTTEEVDASEEDSADETSDTDAGASDSSETDTIAE